MHPSLDAQTVTVIWYLDLEKTIEELYGQNIDILDTIPFEILGQNTFHDFVVDGDTELDLIGDDVIVAKWIETGRFKSLDISGEDETGWKTAGNVEIKHMLHRLFNEGHIPSGKYIVTIAW